ncbi:hypothetical protein Tco_0798953 [Tanacetum coccineum]
MSVQADLVLTPPTSAVRNTVERGDAQNQENPKGATFEAALREYCDKHHHQLLPLIAEKVHQEKVQQDKLKEVKARLNFEGCSRRNSKTQETSQYSELRTPNLRGEQGSKRRSRRSRSMSRSPEPKSVCSRIRRDRLESPRHRDPKRGTVHTRLGRKEKGVFNRMGSKERSVSAHSTDSSEGGHWKPRSKKQKSSIEEDDLSRPWVFLANFLQQKKCIKDPVEIHHIKQRDGESTEDFVQTFKIKSRHVKGAPECMRISGFMHGITNPELIKRLHDKILKSVDEMMRITTAFLRGEVAASNQVRKKTFSAWTFNTIAGRLLETY